MALPWHGTDLPTGAARPLQHCSSVHSTKVKKSPLPSPSPKRAVFLPAPATPLFF